MGQASKKRAVPWIVPALLMLASSTSILSTDLYAPSLPDLTGYFGTEADLVQLTMTLNIAGYALAQLVYGPLADRFGRRPVMIGGMVGFILFSLACALSTTIEFLIASRILQGMTACAEAVVALLIIRDLYDEEDAVRLMGIYGMTISLAPAIGPVIGGFVHVWLGWQANFFILTGMAFSVTLLILRYLPETGNRIVGAARPFRIIGDYGRLLRNANYLSYTLTCSTIMAGLFAFITAAPFILIDLMGVKVEHFGLYQAVIVIAFFFASFVATTLVRKTGVEKLLIIGMAVAIAGGVLLLAIEHMDLMTPMKLTVGMCLYAFGLGLIFATAPIRALDSANTGKGPAAALLGSLEMGGAALGSLVVTLFYDDASYVVSASIFFFGLLTSAIYFLAGNWKKPSGGN